jgi:hypothetical protein
MPFYTSQQIITRACAIAKVTPAMAPIAGVYLNNVLEELCMTYDLEINTATATVSLTGAGPNNGIGPYMLPTNYLRAKSRDLTYYIDGVPKQLIQITLQEMDALILTTGIANYPQNYATDVSPLTTQSAPLLYVYPPPVIIIPLQVRYFLLQSDITTPETSSAIPWFPYQQYLIKRVAGELMGEAGDDRADAYLGDTPSGCVGMLRRYLNLQGDTEDTIQQVQLDARYWGAGGGNFGPSKITGGI